MKVLKIPLTEDDCEFNITLSSLEAINLISMEHNSVLQFSAALLKAMDGQNNETRNDKEV